MVHVALARDRRQRVDLLFHLEHVQRGYTHDLGLTALEDRRTVNARDHVNLGVKRTNVCQTTAVHTNALSEDATANDLLGDRLVGSTELVQSGLGQLAGLNLGSDNFLGCSLDDIICVLTGNLLSDQVNLLELGQRSCFNSGVDLVGVGQEDRVLGDFLGSLARERLLGLDQSGDEGLRSLEALSDNSLVRLDATGLDELPATLGSFSLNHHDGDVFFAGSILDYASCDNEVKDSELELVDVREGNPLALDERKTHTSDGAREGQTRDLGRSRSCVDSQCVVELTGCNRQNRDNDLNLVAQSVNE